MEVTRGDVFWVENKIDYRNLNPVDPSQGKQYRPALVVSEAEEGDKYRNVNVVFLTQHPTQHLETDVTISKSVAHLVEGSVAICKRIYTIRENKLEEKRHLDRVHKDDMKLIDIALAKATGLRILGDKGTEAIIPLTLPELKNPFEKLMKPAQPKNDELICIGCHEKDNYVTMKKRAEAAEQEKEFYKRMYDDLLKKVMDR